MPVIGPPSQNCLEEALLFTLSHGGGAAAARCSAHHGRRASAAGAAARTARPARRVYATVVNRRCRAAIRRDHAAYYADQLREAGPARMWTVLRPVIGAGKSATAAAPACTPEALNAYYVSVGPTTAASVPAPLLRTPVPVRIPRVLTCSLQLQWVGYVALYNIFQKMKRSMLRLLSF